MTSPNQTPATLSRFFKGVEYTLTKAAGGAPGYYHGDRYYDSLTAAAKAITGYKSISGPAFFGVAAEAGARARARAAAAAAGPAPARP